MAIYESIRACDQIEAMDIPIKTAIVNKMQPENPDCDFCRERRKMQIKNLDKIYDEFKEYQIQFPDI